jgi:hypothetical protein
MTLRAVEMQIAIPRTQDIGKIQNQLHQRPTHEQFLLASEQQKENVRKQKSSESLEKTQMNFDKSQDQSNPRRHTYANHKKLKDNQRSENLHPYKGKIIDISL